MGLAHFFPELTEHTCSHSLWELWGPQAINAGIKGGKHFKKNTEGLLPYPRGHQTRLDLAGGQGCCGVH